jgi:hypothetical protein
MTSQSKKKTGGNPAHQDPFIGKLHKTMTASVELTETLQEAVIAGKITQEQWEYYRGGVLAQMEIYRILTGKPSAITHILQGLDVKE